MCGLRLQQQAHFPLPTQVPLNISIREQSDAGAPIVAVQPDSAAAQAYVSVAERVWAKLQQGGGEGGAQPHGPPKIVFA